METENIQDEMLDELEDLLEQPDFSYADFDNLLLDYAFDGDPADILELII